MFKPQLTGAALALTLAILDAICSAPFVVAPDATIAFFEPWFHGFQMSPTAGTITVGRFLYGLVGIAFTGYVAGALFAVCYNALAGKDVRVGSGQGRAAA